MRRRAEGVRASPRRASIGRAGAGCAVALCALCGSPATLAAGTAAHRFTLYSKPKNEAFVNNADDRGRGLGNNPFGNYHSVSASQLPATEAENGPFPGDEGLFTFNLYSQSNFKRSAGVGVLICQYNFSKNAFCDANYQLTGGSLIGAGFFSADATSFVLPITGGTGKYRSIKGDVEATKARLEATSTGVSNQPTDVVLDAQRLAFVIGPA